MLKLFLLLILLFFLKAGVSIYFGTTEIILVCFLYLSFDNAILKVFKAALAAAYK